MPPACTTLPEVNRSHNANFGSYLPLQTLVSGFVLDRPTPASGRAALMAVLAIGLVLDAAFVVYRLL